MLAHARRPNLVGAANGCGLDSLSETTLYRSFPLFHQHSVVTLLGCVFAFFLFAVLTPQFESWALAEPLRMTVLVPVAAVAWYVPRHIRGNDLDVEKQMIFEEAPVRAVEVLQLGD